ncbi:outer membrane protein assembly factor [Fusobacterium sp.]|uniref:BamA/OMP85 family outer membrane protein n=1 Tax=Fusobacterium sp. TaxID=68766 RepID=UPI00260DCBE1|nr:outer membrane protein assembly factor [Fusobacterium sp.]
MRKQLTILLSFLMLVFAYGADTNYKIEKIVVENVQEIPEASILSIMKEKVGDNYSAKEMVADYQKIKELDYVGSVSLYPQYYNEGIKLVVDIREKRDTKELLTKAGIIPMSERDKIDKSVIVKGVEVYGNISMKKKDILKYIPIKTGGYFSKKKVTEGYRNLGESGYFSQVVPDVTRNGNGVTVVYYVTENPTITGINIIGNTVYSTDEILAMLETKPNETLNFNSLRKDREAIIQKYSKDGYVLARVIDIGLNNSYGLDIYITEGIVRDIKLQKMVTKQKGNRRQATDNLLKTKDYVIEREIEFKEGEIFNIKKYNQTEENLKRLGYIKNVKYETRDILGDSDGKEIVLLIDEDRTARLQGAISYGSELGLMGMLSLEETNWKGKGQNASFNYEKSDEDYSSISLNFSDPWIKDTDRISWGWSLYKNGYENDDSRAFNKIDTYGFRVNVGKGITRNVRIGLGTKIENVTTEPDDQYRNGDVTRDGKVVKYYEDKYYLWSLFPSITYDTRNNYFNPTRGEYARWQVEGGYASGENADYFTNTTLELRKYHQGFFKRNTFAYRAVFGIQSDSTKESQRYWIGGSSTLRGYDGGTFRGTRKFTGTIENRTEFNDVLGGVLFFDFGRAWDYKGIDQGYYFSRDNADEKMPSGIAMAAGVGLRINTPMGPLRFDFGWPINDDKEKGMQFYFNMGQSF